MAPRFTDPETAAPYLAPLERLDAELPGLGVSWVRALRDLGRTRFAAAGLPTLKNESWRHTNLKPLSAEAFEPVGVRDALAGFDRLPTVRLYGETGPRLVFVDGRLRPALSTLADLPENVELTSLAQVLDGDPEWLGEHLGRLTELDANPLAALNTAWIDDGAVLRIGRGVEIAEPIELVYVSLGREGAHTVHHPRTLIVVEENAKALVVEHHVSLGDAVTFANHVVEVSVGAGAGLRHYKVQREGTNAFHIAHTTARVARDASYASFVLNAGARIARNEIAVALAEPGAACRLDGAYMARGVQVCDNTTFIDHKAPNGASREVYKGVIGDEARGVFQGKILVRPGAQKTDGHQLNRTLLLSERAQIDAKPELEIYADDVKCSHGATAGELDDDQLFYLRARGIPLDQARGLLVAAFLSDVLDDIPEEGVRDAFAAVIDGWMKGR